MQHVEVFYAKHDINALQGDVELLYDYGYLCIDHIYIVCIHVQM